MLNWQIPILTEGEHSNARIININTEKINKFIEKGVAVVPGFQGISADGEVTTIGRGGSDATAVAIAKLLNADSCEIYTDVDGIYSTDPNRIPVAKKLKKFHMMRCSNYLLLVQKLCSLLQCKPQ